MIHPTAIIDPSARLGKNIQIGAYSIISADVEIGDDTWIGPHVVIQGPTKIGRENQIFQFASIGEIPQDKKFKGEKTFLEIGDRNVFRECCTVNRGTAQDKGLTKIGNDNLLMAYVHIAHDCMVGNHNIFANNASLAGHVIMEDYVILSGFSGVFQFCRMGSHSFAAMGALIGKDVPPFVKVAEPYAKPFGLNTVGMKRFGLSDETIMNLKRAYKIIYRKGLTIEHALEELKTMILECPEVQFFIDFISTSKNGILR